MSMCVYAYVRDLGWVPNFWDDFRKFVFGYFYEKLSVGSYFQQ